MLKLAVMKKNDGEKLNGYCLFTTDLQVGKFREKNKGAILAVVEVEDKKYTKEQLEALVIETSQRHDSR